MMWINTVTFGVSIVAIGMAYSLGTKIRELSERVDKIDDFLQDVCEDFHKSRIELEERVGDVESSLS